MHLLMNFLEVYYGTLTAGYSRLIVIVNEYLMKMLFQP